MDCFLFSGLDDSQMSIIIDLLGQPVTILKGQELYKNGEMGILFKGTAKIKRQGETGASVTVRTIGSCEVFGAASMFGKWESGFSKIIADEKCWVYYVTEQTLKSIFTRFPQTALNYIAFLTDRIRFLNRRIDAFSADSTESKLFEYLVSQSDDFGRVELKFSMAELSRRLKIGRSSLYRSLAELEKSGHVKREKNVILLSKGDSYNEKIS